jgi:radical SAM protein with 4Fe4S-binding SPASM domain
MCPHDQQIMQGDMDPATAEIVARQIGKYAHFIQLYFVGEPTINRHLIEIVKVVRTHTQATLEISTNAVRLERQKLADALLLSGIDRIVCCIEGASRESHTALRTTGDFERTEDIVKNLANRQNELGTKVSIFIKCILSKFNQGERDDFINRWSSVHGVTPRISWMNTWGGTMSELRDIAIELCPNVALIRQPCAELWNKCVIRWNGEVVLCCHDWRNEVLLGNINDSPLLNIWNSSDFEIRRSEHMGGVYLGICKDCIEWSRPEEYIDDYSLRDEQIVKPS